MKAQDSIEPENGREGQTFDTDAGLLSEVIYETRIGECVDKATT